MRPRNPGTSVTGSGKSRVTEKHQRYRGCNPVTRVTRALRVGAGARASVCDRGCGCCVGHQPMSPVCVYGVTRVTQVTYREKQGFRSNPIVTRRGGSGYLRGVAAPARDNSPRSGGASPTLVPSTIPLRSGRGAGGGAAAGARAPQERPRPLRTTTVSRRGVRGRYGATSCVWRGVWPGARMVGRTDGRTGHGCEGLSEAPRAQEGTG